MFNRFLSGPLRDAAGDPAGGGNPPPATPPPIDVDALMTRFEGILDKRVNALDKKLNGFEKRLPTTEPPVNPQVPPAGDPPAGDPPVNPKTVAEVNGELVKLRKAVETLTTENANSKKAAEDSEKKRLDTERSAAVDNVLADIQFASPKAREQFRAAYSSQVVRDDDGNLVVQTDKGPVAYKDYLTAEAEASPHFLAPTGAGGSGATAGTRPRQGQKANVLDMSIHEYQKLTPEQRTQMFQESMRAATS